MQREREKREKESTKAKTGCRKTTSLNVKDTKQNTQS